MKVKTNELTGVALDWAVAKCVNPAHWMIRTHQDNEDQWYVTLHGGRGNYAPSTDWNQGGPIIERERILIQPEIGKENSGNAWSAISLTGYVSYGPTPLIAVMRCYVASKLGDEVEIPNELLT